MGTIRQVYPFGRDAVMLAFPCFEIEARFDPGMSGGLVVDESGRLCGLICLRRFALADAEDRNFR